MVTGANSTAAAVAAEAKQAREAERERREKAKRPLVRLPILIMFILLVVAGGVFAFFQLRQDNSDTGVVRRHLVAGELTLDPAVRESELTPVDQMGVRGVQAAIALLTDTRKAQSSSGHSETPVQRLALAYLVRYAGIVKFEAPTVATEMTKAFFDGTPVPNTKWDEAQRAWQKWATDAQAKGAIK